MRKHELKKRLQTEYLNNMYLKQDNARLQNELATVTIERKTCSKNRAELFQRVTFLERLTENITLDDKADISRVLLENEKLRSDNKYLSQNNRQLTARLRMTKGDKMDNDIFTEEELKERFDAWLNRVYTDGYPDIYTLAFFAYKKGLDDGWDDAIEAHR